MIFDTHAHYDHRRFDEDRESLVASLPEKGVGLVLNPGISLETSRAAADLARRHRHVYAAAGIHPKYVLDLPEDWRETLRALAGEEKVVAIGEIGLDFYWEKESAARQEEIFCAQLDLARELDKPVIIHDREAHRETMAVLREYPDLRGEVHCFSGDAAMAEELLARGWYLGFDGPVTFQMNQDHARSVACAVPLERMLLETDAPFLTPAPHRKERNDSTYLPLVARRLAAWKGVAEEKLTNITWDNGCRFFGIVPEETETDHDF